MDGSRRYTLIAVLLAALLATPIILRSDLSLSVKVVTLTLGTAFVVIRFVGMSWPGKP